MSFIRSTAASLELYTLWLLNIQLGILITFSFLWEMPHLRISRAWEQTLSSPLEISKSCCLNKLHDFYQPMALYLAWKNIPQFLLILWLLLFRKKNLRKHLLTVQALIHPSIWELHINSLLQWMDHLHGLSIIQSILYHHYHWAFYLWGKK